MNIPVPASQSRFTWDDLNAVDQPIGQARGMPNAAYTEQRFFEFERDRIMATHWTAIGFVHRLEPAMVRPLDLMGLPLLVSKTKAGEVRVFHNVCSHRGTLLVEQAKKTNGLIVCPYHGWSYSVEGDLKATPNIGGVGIHSVPGFDCGNHGLKEIRSHVWLGILFINLDGNAPEFEVDAAPLIKRCRGLVGETGEAHARPARTHSGISLSMECNWKLAVENFLEAYHLPMIHPGLNSYSPLSKHHNEIFFENSSGQVTESFDLKLGSANPLPIFPGWNPDRLDTGEYPALYPNLFLGFQANHLFAIIIDPVSPTQCREDLLLYYVGHGADSDRFEEARKANLAAWLEIFNEDIRPCEMMQRGRCSPGYHGGAFSPVHDTCTHHFHKWIAQQYQTAGRDGFPAGNSPG